MQQLGPNCRVVICYTSLDKAHYLASSGMKMSPFRNFAICVIALITYVSKATVAFECTWDSGKGATFDLSPLQKNGDTQTLYYSVMDKYRIDDDNANSKYKYFFNVCANASKPMLSKPSKPDLCQGISTAYQVEMENTSPNRCWRIGSDIRVGGSSQWGLLEEDDPSRGVTLTYLNGEECGKNDSSTTEKNPRELVLRVHCDNNFNGIVEDEAPIEQEQGKCKYKLELKSIYGCPLECGISSSTNGRHLCNNKGPCRFDKKTNKSRCFCADGWEGSDCSKRTEKASNKSLLAGLIVVSIFLVITFIGIALMWRKVQTLRLDPAAYQKMPEEEKRLASESTEFAL